MKKFLPILLFLLSCYNILLSQDYPVQVTTIVTPPYSLYLSDYASPESNSLQVMLQLKELDRPEYRVKLRITIEGQGITLRTKPAFMPRALVLQGGVPEMLTGADLSAYLNPNNMDFLGTTQQAFMRTGMFPEGFYTFKVEVLDYIRNVVVSNAGIGNAFIILNDPPLINLPFNNDKVIATDPQNIIFSWTPRHTASPNAAFSTEYEFTLVELYPDNRNPNDAIRAANSIYTTTTTATSLNYGIIEPILIPGRKYAFRIRAYDISGKDLFKNNGYSEVNVFQFGDACVAPLNVQADPLDPVRIKFSWEQQDVHTGYSLEFRKEGTNTWEQQSVINDAVIVPGLQGNTTYEYRVQGQCGSIQGPFSTLATVLTPASDSAAFVCGAPVPEIEINTTPLDRNLRLLDIIKTADFEIIVTDLTANGDGSYKGTGRAMVPWFKLAGVRVKFSNIKVNQDLRVFSGNVTTIYSKDSRFVLGIDLSRDDAEAPDSGAPTAPTAFTGLDTVLTVPITNVAIPAGNNAVIVVTTPDGQTFEIPRERNEDGTFEDTRITDANGDTWTVSSTGQIQQGPNVAPPAAFASRDSVNFRVNFDAIATQYYGFDNKHFTDVPEDRISINNEDYWIAWKSVETGRQDYVSATAPGKTTFPERIGFKTASAPAIHETGSSAAFRRVSVMGLVDQQVEALTAYVRVQEQGQQAEEIEVGRLNVKAYDKVQKKVIVIPVNGVSIPSAGVITEELNKIYTQAVVGWEVVVEPSITVDASVIQNLDVGVSDMLSSFPENMLSFVRTFRNDVNRFIDGDAYYIFMLNNPNAGRAGFMPFNRKFGFVYTNKTTNVITTMAHELGHGAFNLRHTFSPEAMLATEGSTDNLMDYSNGTKLKKFQWDLVRNQETINGWFEDDSETEFGSFQFLAGQNVVPGVFTNSVANVGNTASFVTIAGKILTIPSSATDVTFYDNGILSAFTVGGERYVSAVYTSTAKAGKFAGFRKNFQSQQTSSGANIYQDYSSKDLASPAIVYLGIPATPAAAQATSTPACEINLYKSTFPIEVTPPWNSGGNDLQKLTTDDFKLKLNIPSGEETNPLYGSKIKSLDIKVSSPSCNLCAAGVRFVERYSAAIPSTSEYDALLSTAQRMCQFNDNDLLAAFSAETEAEIKSKLGDWLDWKDAVSDAFWARPDAWQTYNRKLNLFLDIYYTLKSNGSLSTLPNHKIKAIVNARTEEFLNLYSVEERIGLIKNLLPEPKVGNFNNYSEFYVSNSEENAILKVLRSIQSQTDASEFLTGISSDGFLQKLNLHIDDFGFGGNNYTNLSKQFQRLTLLKNGITNAIIKSQWTQLIPENNHFVYNDTRTFSFGTVKPEDGAVYYKSVSYDANAKMVISYEVCEGTQVSYREQNIGHGESASVKVVSCLVERPYTKTPDFFDLISIDVISNIDFLPETPQSNSLGNAYVTYAGYLDYIEEKKGTEQVTKIAEYSLTTASLAFGVGEVALLIRGGASAGRIMLASIDLGAELASLILETEEFAKLVCNGALDCETLQNLRTATTIAQISAIVTSGFDIAQNWNSIKKVSTLRIFSIDELRALSRAELPDFVRDNLADLLTDVNRNSIWALTDQTAGQFKRGDLIEEIFNQWDGKYGGYQNLNDIIRNYPTLDFDGVLNNINEVVSLKTYHPTSTTPKTLSLITDKIDHYASKLSSAILDPAHANKSRVLDFTIKRGEWSSFMTQIRQEVINIQNDYGNVVIRITEF